ncbi:hypothetical protein JCM33374_g5447 [Metschnikowia sp. JCM 33374]|nr:hypothetical protein JCM33374_g5447 [Metschnikowia sp. JCM 33374]
MQNILSITWDEAGSIILVSQLFSRGTTSKQTGKRENSIHSRMDLHQSVLNSVANIQDELKRISTLASLFESRSSGSDLEFRNKALQEFNTKIHKMSSENFSLCEKNKRLTEKVKRLESQVRGLQSQVDLRPLKARPFKSEGALKIESNSEIFEPPSKKRILGNNKRRSEILSSPIKQDGVLEIKKSPVKIIGTQFETEDKNELTSSQFNRLATQYSDSGSQQESLLASIGSHNTRDPLARFNIGKPERKTFHGASRSSSPYKRNSANLRKNSSVVIKGSFASDDESEDNSSEGVNPVVADSQDEFEPLKNMGSPQKHINTKQSSTTSKPKYPAHYTALQRAEFLRNYFQPKITEKNFKVDFSRNPITEKRWAVEDFVPNETWNPPKKINQNLGVMTKAQEKTYDDFFNKAGLGRKTSGPTWDSDEESNPKVDGVDWVRSQVMDKYSSPPGYMVGDFASTQEEKERKRLKDEKELDRIRRRFESAISRGEFLFYEPVLNEFAKAGKYVSGP